MPWLFGGLGQSEAEFSLPISGTFAKVTLSDIPVFIVLVEQLFRIQQHTQKYAVPTATILL